MKIFYKSFYILFSRGISILSSSISAIILAKYLGPELRGQYAIIIAVALIILNFFCFGLKEALIVTKRKDHIKKIYFIDSLVIFLWFSISIFTSVLSIVYIYLFLENSLDYYTYILIAGYILTSAKMYFFEAKLILDGKIISYSNISAADKFFKTIAIFIMVVLYNLKIDGALIAIIISNLLSSLIYYRYIDFSKFRFVMPVLDDISFIYKLGMPYGFVILFTNLINNIDLILINFYIGDYKTGLYSISLRIIDLLLIFCQSVCFIIFADIELVKKNKSEQIMVFKKIFFMMVISYIFISIGLLLFIDEVVIILFGLKYESSASIVYYLLPSLMGMIIYKLIYHFISKDGPNSDFIIISFLALIFNIVLNYILVPIYGIYGAAISKSITFLILGLMSLYISKSFLWS